jgi:hypothetical protein
MNRLAKLIAQARALEARSWALDELAVALASTESSGLQEAADCLGRHGEHGAAANLRALLPLRAELQQLYVEATAAIAELGPPIAAAALGIGLGQHLRDPSDREFRVESVHFGTGNPDRTPQCVFGGPTILKGGKHGRPSSVAINLPEGIE